MTAPTQQQLIAARQSQILDAAARVFAEKGFHLTTIKDIARAAGTADGTIYNYFANKTALLIAILDRMRDQMMQNVDLDVLTSQDVRAILRTFLAHPLMALQADDFALARVIMSETAVNPELRTLYEQKILQPTLAAAETLLQTLAAQGLIRSVNIPLTIRVISGMVWGALFQRIAGEALITAAWETLPEAIADLLIYGIGADAE